MRSVDGGASYGPEEIIAQPGKNVFTENLTLTMHKFGPGDNIIGSSACPCILQMLFS